MKLSSLAIEGLGDFPPRYSKLSPCVWEQALKLYAANNGRVTLRTLGAACRVSHRTAWRIRETLRDREQVLRERSGHRRAAQACSAPVQTHPGD